MAREQTPTRTLACPLCGGQARPAFSTGDRNRGVSRAVFHYARCSDCRSYFLEDHPPDLGRFYPEEYFSLPSASGLRDQARAERYRMELVARHAPGGRLTEIGPGNGIFAVQAVDAGYETAAIEQSAAACGYLRTVLGIEVVNSDRPEAALAGMAPSRVIAAWHVLEHVAAPWDLVAAAAANLESGGVLVVATPNPRAFGLRALGRRWPHVDAPRHLFLIDHEALVAQSRRVGLEPVALTHTDPGGLHWNAFAWHYSLRTPGASYLWELVAQRLGQVTASALAPIERRGLNGAAYTLVLRKR